MRTIPAGSVSAASAFFFSCPDTPETCTVTADGNANTVVVKDIASTQRTLQSETLEKSKDINPATPDTFIEDIKSTKST